MKKAMSHTKVSVRLRKSELRDEWYLYLEAYPVFKAGREKPLREREYLNRIITTPMWDKTRPARLNTNGEQSFKPKRDQNGIIICRSKADRDVCIFADNVRNLRQHEYDNAELYSEADQAMAEKIENGKLNFIEYFAKVAENRHKKGSKSIIINWNRVYDLIKIYAEGDFYPFSKVTLRMVESFKNFMLTAPQGGNKSGIVSQNTAATYFAIFKAAFHFCSNVNIEISIDEGL
uniref:phage integrase SAM-like domain and Arm DNA-binding domain-containing protein n=1 Tax=Prevotella pectinovora TaxID=1602169 RepID=UPI003080B578